MSAKNNDKKSNEPASALDGARERAVKAYDDAREGASTAGRKVSEQFVDSPLAGLVGGIAAGAIIAALLPTSRRERDLLAPVTDNIKDRASAAVEAAKSAGQARFGELGLTRDAGGEAIRSIVEGATDALKSSARAAATSVRGDGDAA